MKYSTIAFVVMVFGLINISVSYADDTELVAKYHKECDGGKADSCYDLGVMYDSGKGVAVDYKIASDQYRKACDGGIADGCLNIGTMYIKGDRVPADYKKALSSFKKACEKGSPNGCKSYKLLYDEMK